MKDNKDRINSLSLLNFYRKYNLPQEFQLYYHAIKEDCWYDIIPVIQGHTEFNYYIPFETPIKGFTRMVISKNAYEYIEEYEDEALNDLRVKFMPWPEIVLPKVWRIKKGYYKETDQLDATNILFEYDGIDFRPRQNVGRYDKLILKESKPVVDFEPESIRGGIHFSNARFLVDDFSNKNVLAKDIVEKISLFLLQCNTDINFYCDYIAIEKSSYDIKACNYDFVTEYEYDYYVGRIPIGKKEQAPKERFTHHIFDGRIVRPQSIYNKKVSEEQIIYSFAQDLNEIICKRLIAKSIYDYITNKAMEHFTNVCNWGPTIFVDLKKLVISTQGDSNDDNIFTIDYNCYYKWEDDYSEETSHPIVDSMAIERFSISIVEEYYDIKLYFPVSKDFVFLECI